MQGILYSIPTLLASENFFNIISRYRDNKGD